MRLFLYFLRFQPSLKRSITIINDQKRSKAIIYLFTICFRFKSIRYKLLYRNALSSLLILHSIKTLKTFFTFLSL